MGARLADRSAGIGDRTNRASLGIFQQQSLLVGISSAVRTNTHGVSEDLFAVDGSIRATKPIRPQIGARTACTFSTQVFGCCSSLMSLFNVAYWPFSTLFASWI